MEKWDFLLALLFFFARGLTCYGQLPEQNLLEISEHTSIIFNLR